jgi:multiple antibiotic resistance protein
MIESLLQLTLLFFVIFDPMVSFTVFTVATSHMPEIEKKKVALIAISVALGLSLAVLILGESLLTLFSTNIQDFRVAGGIILILLGIKMTLGNSLANVDDIKGNSDVAIAAIIGTPLITGPAAITTIIISINDYGRLLVGLAILIVMAFTALIFFNARWVQKFIGRTGTQIMSTTLGLITIAWGVKFIRAGLGI